MTKPKKQNLAIVWPEAGHYIVAVSGGVDSVVLLDLLALAQADRNYQLEVAYYDHGWRADVEQDQAERYNLPVHFGKYQVQSKTEAAARQQRYEFLEQVRLAVGAAAIITAHHADDRLETAVFNTIRGTGSAGLVSLASTDQLQRPLLGVRKADLVDYATSHQLNWHEDTTNAETTQARNFIRHELLADNPEFATTIMKQLDDQQQRQIELETAITGWLAAAAVEKVRTVLLDRPAVAKLTLPELEAVLVSVVRRRQPGLNIDQPAVVEMARFAKSAATGKVMVGTSGLRLEIGNAAVELAFPSSKRPK
jgi:tRNA(Ile)-lysidine synthase